MNECAISFLGLEWALRNFVVRKRMVNCQWGEGGQSKALFGQPSLSPLENFQNLRHLWLSLTASLISNLARFKKEFWRILLAQSSFLKEFFENYTKLPFKTFQSTLRFSCFNVQSALQSIQATVPQIMMQISWNLV